LESSCTREIMTISSLTVSAIQSQALRKHPGVCPRRVEVFPFIPCKNTCNNDHDCRLTEKCCFTGCSRGCLPSGVDRCRLPRDQGSCSKELQHFYYDPEEKKCISFVYHGCEGNSNNFETRELCEKTCGKISKGTEDEEKGHNP
uniref:Uncharacterized protein n=1 Tax=Laticauda laticaudata TaxID=8630 RepID=A0A8C5RKB0_LATLA